MFFISKNQFSIRRNVGNDPRDNLKKNRTFWFFHDFQDFSDIWIHMTILSTWHCIVLVRGTMIKHHQTYFHWEGFEQPYGFHCELYIKWRPWHDSICIYGTEKHYGTFWSWIRYQNIFPLSFSCDFPLTP